MNTLWADARYALRRLLKNPGFSLIAVLTLALGIGLNTAIYTVAHHTLLQPLPFKEADGLLVMSSTFPERNWTFATASIVELLDHRERNNLLQDVAIFDYRMSVALSGHGQTELLATSWVTSNYFSLLGANAAMGRTFLPEEDQSPDAHPVAILSDQLWRNRFQSAPDIIGSKITLTGQPFTVVGVMPASFRDLRERHDKPPDIWLPLTMSRPFYGQGIYEGRGVRSFWGLARLKDNATLAQAQAASDEIARQLAVEFPQPHQGRGLRLRPLDDYFYGELKQPLQMLLAAAALVLLICCVNVAMLLLVRARSRRLDIALRAALGASRSRLFREALSEGILLSLAGSLIGSLLAYLATKALGALGSLSLPAFTDLKVDAGVLAFSLLLAALTSLLAAIMPAIYCVETDPQTILKSGGRSIKESGRRFYLLVAVEVALAVVLLVGASLLAKSFYRLIHTDLGFNTRNLVTMRVSLQGLPYHDLPVFSQFIETVEDELQAIPGVESASIWGPGMLGNAQMNCIIARAGEDWRDRRNQFFSQTILLTPRSLQALQVPLLRGRYFTAADRMERSGAPRVIIINESLAETLWPGEDAVGRQVTLNSDGASATVVGVVADVLNRGRLSPAQEVGDVYFPFRQMLTGDIHNIWSRYLDFSIVVRSRVGMTVSPEAVREVISRLDPNVPLFDVATMQERLDRESTAPRFTASLMGVYALLALILSAVGIFGVLAYTVRQQINELAVRSALGAEPRQLFLLVLRRGLIPVLIGEAVGAGAALALSSYIRSLLYDMSATDLTIYIVVVLAHVFVALAACYLPARWASRVDPMVALRSE